MAESEVTAITDDGEPTLIATGGESSETHARVKVTGAEAVYLGGPEVSAADGFPVAPDETVVTQLAAGEKLYGAVEVTDPAAASEVTVLVTSKGSIFAP